MPEETALRRTSRAYLDGKAGSLRVVLCQDAQLEAGVGLQILDLLPDARLLLDSAAGSIKRGKGDHPCAVSAEGGMATSRNGRMASRSLGIDGDSLPGKAGGNVKYAAVGKSNVFTSPVVRNPATSITGVKSPVGSSSGLFTPSMRASATATHTHTHTHRLVEFRCGAWIDACS